MESPGPSLIWVSIPVILLCWFRGRWSWRRVILGITVWIGSDHFLEGARANSQKTMLLVWPGQTPWGRRLPWRSSPDLPWLCSKALCSPGINRGIVFKGSFPPYLPLPPQIPPSLCHTLWTQEVFHTQKGLSCPNYPPSLFTWRCPPVSLGLAIFQVLQCLGTLITEAFSLFLPLNMKEML